MREERITNPSSVDRQEIEAKIAAGARVILQFSELCYSSELLKKINNLCGELGKNLEVRFWGHYRNKFDASKLSFLPDVVALSVDALMEVINPFALCELRHLRHLSLGIFKLDSPDFLKSLKLQNLERFCLWETVKSNFDLSPLKDCIILEDLTLFNHVKNINCLAHLPTLRKLSLWRIPKKQNLEFVSRIHKLKSCKIVLGGRTNISEVQHSSLEELEIHRVMGFSGFENLEKFPSLRSLMIEDQIRLERLRFTASNKLLQTLRIFNCKGLRHLEGLNYLTSLDKIFIGKTALNVDSLIQQRLPSSLKIFGFYTGKVRENAEARKKLDALGYAER